MDKLLIDGDPDRQRFALDIWEIIISFIPDEHQPTLISLSYVSRDLCITLRRRLFRKVTFSLTHKPNHALNAQAQLAEPFTSPSAKLLLILKSNPGLSEYIRHLEIQVISRSTRDIHNFKEVGHYDDLSLTKLAPYLINLSCLSFTSQPSISAFRWNNLPELVRETIYPFLSVVSDLIAPDLYDMPSSVIFHSRTTPLRALSVGMYGLFLDGKRFPADVLGSPSPVYRNDFYQSQQTMIRSLTIDSRCDYHHWNPFPQWLTIDNPMFPISINHLENLVFVQRQYILGTKHGFQRMLERCARTLRMLRLPPGYNIEGMPEQGKVIMRMRILLIIVTEAMRGKLTWKASQRMHYKGEVPDLSLLTNLESCRMTVFIRFSGEDYFTTTLPYVIKTLKTLPPAENGKASLTELWIDLCLENFEDHLRVMQLDWSQFTNFILQGLRFSHLERVIVAVACIPRTTGVRRNPLALNVEPPTTIMYALRHNVGLKRLIDQGLLQIQAALE